MTRTSVNRFALLAGGMAFLAACQDSEPTSSARTDVPQQQVELDGASLASAIPGFGGLYLDEKGVPTVYLTEGGDENAARRVLGAFAKRAANGEMRVREGSFTWQQLDAWHQKMIEAFEVPGVIMTDLDEASNTVTIGVERGYNGRGVKGVAARLGVPDAAVKIVEMDPIYPAVTLRDKAPAIQAGWQVNYGNYVCSVGFNAVANGVSSLVTASHCTNTQGGTEGTVYYQPVSSLSAVVATEAVDPTYSKNLPGCPKGKNCRYSDASRANYAVSAPVALGQIARTTSRGTLTGSLTIDATNPFFSVTGEGDAVVGQQVNKVGRTTGWTYGNVTNTCVTIGVAGTNKALLCQDVASMGVQGGDSGSGVFAWNGASGATILGILWGGNSAGNQSIFSPMNQVEQEIGALTTQ